MRKVYSLLLSISLFAISQANAQFAVTTNSGSGLAGSYPSLAAAITALNGATISSPVVITCPTGSETAPSGGYTITASGTAVNTITIQGNGAANSIITAAAPAGVAGSLTDGIIKLVGADYVTIQGFALQENAANTTTAAATNNMMEWGIALLYATTTNGAQNNTIQNNTITLNRTYQNSFGIYSNSTHSATTVTTSATATTSTGGNSGMKVYGNTITNVNNGICVVGPTAAADLNNGVDIGGASAATGNTISNFGTTGTFSGFNLVSGSVNGVLVRNTTAVNVSYNTISSSVGGTTSGTLRGIYLQAASNAPTGTFTSSFNNNTIALTQGGAGNAINGVLVDGTTGTATSTLNINTNNFTALTCTVVTSGTITAISTAMANLATNINGNLFTNITTNTTGTFTFISHGYSMPSGGSQSFSNNSIVTAFNKTGAGPLTITTSNSTSTSGSTSSYVNNNFSNITVTGASTVLGFNNTDGGSGSAKTITGNVFNNWTCGTNSVTAMNFTYFSGSSVISGNTITNITGQSTVIGMNIGNTASGTAVNITSNTITNLSSTGTGGSVTGLSCSNSSTTVTVNSNIVNTLSSTGASSTVLGLNVSGSGTNNVYQNTVHTVSSSGSTGPVVQGMVIGGGAPSSVYRNKIYNLSASAAITTTNPVAGLTISGGTTITAYNNLIGDLKAATASSANAIAGILVSGGTTVNVYYNTVYLNASSTGANFGTAAIYTSTTPTLTLRNNIFVNLSAPAGTGKTVAYQRNGISLTTYGSTSNNNLYYAGAPSATRLIFYDGTNSDQTLAAFKIRVSPMDASSISENPNFLSTTGSAPDFLHINTTIATAIESGASPIGSVTDDYDADVRNATTPDIGADEFAGVGLDVVAPAMTYTLLPYTCSTSDITLTANISDISGVATGGLSPRIYFKKSTSGSYVSTQGTLTSGTAANGVWTFTISNSLLAGGSVSTGDVIQYFIVAQDASAQNNLGSSPSGVTATDVNTVTTPPTPNSYSINSLLSGSINVGAGQTYTTLTAAAAAYNNACLSGNVFFNLTDATYGAAETFPIVFNTNSYANASNNLTIRPASGVNATITGTVNTGSVIKLNGADYITIDGSNNGSTSRNLTIKNASTTTSGNSVLWLAAPASGNGALNNTIKNTIIEGDASTTTMMGIYVGGNTTISTTAAGSEANNNNTITNNLFRKTQYGIVMFGYAAATPDNNNVISNNLVGTATAGEGFNLEGIHADRQNNLQVSGNDVQNVRGTSGTNQYGIRLLDFKNGLAYNNKVHNVAYTSTSTPKIYGLAVVNSTYTTAGNPSNSMIYNNLVYDITSSGVSSIWNLTGMLAGSGYGDKYYYNTIHLTGQINNSSSGLSAGFANGDETNTGFGTNLDVRNNIINVEGTTLGPVWAYYSKATTLSGTIQNYNLLRAAATGGTNNIGRLNSLNYTTLGAWQTASGVDANSISVDPALNSGTNLQPLPGSPVLGAGTPVAGITTDILGVTRSATNPSIGAYEQGADGAPPVITHTQVGFTCSVANRTVTATITDYTGVPTSGSLMPRIYYKKSTGSTWFSQAGTLASGSATNGTWNFTINYSDLGPVGFGDIIQYYIIAQDAAAGNNLGSSPSGAVGTDVNNVSTPPTPFSYSINSPLASGTYTVGVGGNYTTLTAAVAAYNNSCLAGPIVFSLTDATYSAGETFPITVSAHGDASAVNTLTIRPAAGIDATITGSAAAIIKLNGSDYVTIDGSNAGTSSRNLTIQNTSTSAGAVGVWVASLGASAGATNVTLKNTTIKGASLTATNFGVFVGHSNGAAAGPDNDNITISNNAIKRVYYGIQAVGDVAGVNDNLTITGNTIGDAVDSIGKYGILASYATNASISRNTIQYVVFNGGNAFGLLLSTGFVNSTVDGNKITNIAATGTSGYGGKGIDISTGTSTSNLIVSNNMVSDIRGDGWGTLTSDAIIGIRIYNSTLSGGIKLYNNSVNLGSGSFAGYATQGNSAALYIGSTSANIEVVNNILSSNLVNTAYSSAKTYAIYSDAPIGSFTTINNNDYYVSGSQGVLAYLGADKTTLAAIQTAFGQNTASKTVQPFYVSSNDLHLTADMNCALDAAGTPLAAVTTDFDAETRNATTPDIGADEFANTFVLAVTNGQVCSPATVNLTTLTTGSTSAGTFGYFSDAALTTPVPNPASVTSGTYYIQLTKGSCNPSQSVVATVDPVTVAGTVSSSQTICGGSQPADLSLSGNVGAVVKWQSSTVGDFSASVTDIANTTTTLTGAAAGSLTVTTYYRAVVKSGTCNTEYTTPVTITVNPPVNISVQPAAQNVCPAGTATFTVTAANATAYQWKKDGVDIPGANSNSYSVTNAGAADVATYTVSISGTSPCATVLSSGAALTLKTVTSISSSPASQTVCAGTPVSFSVTAAGSGSFTYQWRKGGVDISGANSSTYSIASAVAGDAGNYDVVVTADCGSASSATATLTVNGSLNITSSPSSQTVCEGTPASFSVSATGTGTLTYQWRKNSVNISGATASTYSIATTVPVDAGTYDVVVTSLCGSFPSASATLTVNPVTSITTAPTAQTVCAGTTATFTVAASGTGTLTYQWRKGGSNITGANAATYSIASAVAADAGSYDVIVTGGCGSVTTTAVSLTVNPVTTITTAPVAQTVCAGTAASFTVAASGTGTLTYQWKKNGTNITGATAATFNIASTVAADAANYSVTVTGGCGSVTTTPVSLTVNPVTAITTNPSSQTACPGTSVTFSVSATGTGTLTYQWRKNGTNITGATASSYTISSVVAGDAGNYDVVVTGGCGSATSTAATLTTNQTITISSQPTAQGACLGGSATFSITVAGSGPFTYQWRKGTVNIAGATASTYTITGVTAASAANYDVVVTGGCGSVTSVPVPLTINPATTITTQPTAQTGCIGGSATFTVAGNGSGTLSYQWRKTGTNITGATSATLTLAGLTAGDAASYDVIVTANCGSVTSNAVALTVNPATVITTQPVAQTICALNQAQFTVAATGTGTLTYQWRKNGVNITGATATTYTIASAATGDAGNYDVVITSSCGTLTSTAVALTVNACTAIPTVEEDITSAMLMPNIVSQNTTLRVVARRAMKVDWTVTDAKGRVVMQFSQSITSGQNDLRIQAGNLANGTYFLNGKTRNGKLKTIRFVRL